MSEDVERINQVLDDLAAEQDPALRSALSGEEQELAETAAFLKSAAPDRTQLREAFLEALEHHIADAGTVKSEEHDAVRTRRSVSRRSILGKVAAAVAGLAVGGGATMATAYDRG